MKNKKFNNRAKRSIEKVAANNNTTPAEVRREIEAAIRWARLNPDPKVREFWASIPHKGEYPTPEEAIVYLSNRVK